MYTLNESCHTYLWDGLDTSAAHDTDTYWDTFLKVSVMWCQTKRHGMKRCRQWLHSLCSSFSCNICNKWCAKLQFDINLRRSKYKASIADIDPYTDTFWIKKQLVRLTKDNTLPKLMFLFMNMGKKNNLSIIKWLCASLISALLRTLLVHLNING